MLLELREEIKKSLAGYGEEAGKIEIKEAPPGMGDFGLDIAFKLAKNLRKSPLETASEIKQMLEKNLSEYVEKIEVVNGYLNLFLKRDKALEYLLNFSPDHLKREENGKIKVVVEHTSVNPNKAMHVGHLRNACLGDSIARLLRVFGFEVETHNYIDDTGVQVCTSLLGLIEGKNIEKIRERNFLSEMQRKLLEIEKMERIDHYFWEMYSKVYEKYGDEELNEYIKIMLAEMERPESEFHRFAKKFAEKIVEKHLETLAALNIYFDVLPRESDILALGFWKEAFETLRKSENFVLEESGPNKGCWVVKLAHHEMFRGMKNPDKIIVKSDGTVTYTGKDIAYHLWKFGILKKDFFYRRFSEKFPRTWITESCETGEEPGKKFAHAKRVINVIDVRQQYLQDVLKACLETLGYEEQAKNLLHYGYEVVALSPSCMQELGKIDKKYLHMSGRKGIGVKAGDFIEAVKSKLREEVEKRYGNTLKKEEIEHLAEKLMCAAIRYYMLKQNVTKVLVFDFNDALRFDGDTGIYLQYAMVRAKNILKRCSREAGIREPEEGEWKLVRKLLEVELVLEHAKNSLDLSVLTDYAIELAKTFTEFYHQCRVAGSEREDVRRAVVESFIKVLSVLFYVLGIPEVEKM